MNPSSLRKQKFEALHLYHQGQESMLKLDKTRCVNLLPNTLVECLSQVEVKTKTAFIIKF